MKTIKDEKDVETSKEASNLRLAYSSGRVDEFDWLSKLPVETIFLAKPKKVDQNIPSYALIEFLITGKSDRAVRLKTIIMGQEIHEWVDPQSFSFIYREFDILVNGADLIKAREDLENGTNNRTNQ